MMSYQSVQETGPPVSWPSLSRASTTRLHSQRTGAASIRQTSRKGVHMLSPSSARPRASAWLFIQSKKVTIVLSYVTWYYYKYLSRLLYLASFWILCKKIMIILPVWLSSIRTYIHMFPSVSTYSDAHSFNLWLDLGLCAMGATGHLVLYMSKSHFISKL